MRNKLTTEIKNKLLYKQPLSTSIEIDDFSKESAEQILCWYSTPNWREFNNIIDRFIELPLTRYTIEYKDGAIAKEICMMLE